MFSLDVITAWAKRRGFVYPGSDIYGGLANAWDYGPYGIQLKKNIQDLRWKTFIQQRPDMIGLDAQILMHPKTWEASGHVAGFNDPLIDDKKTGERFRADKLIEDYIHADLKKIKDDQRYRERIISHLSELQQSYLKFEKELEVNFDEEIIVEYIKKDPFIGMKEYYGFALVTKNLERGLDSKDDDIDCISDATVLVLPNLIPESWDFITMRAFIQEFIPNNPNKKKQAAERTDVRKFELMFYTYQGVIHDEDNKIWMRPETAQGIFVNFKNVLDTTRMRVPFGIGQMGKSFRNEITPGNFLYRTREFEQMEIEYFVEDDDAVAEVSFKERQELSMQFWLETLQLSQANLRFREHEKDELSHYSKGTFDVEFQYPRGWGELQGIAWRGNFDLTQHQEHSGKSMQYQDPYTNQRYIPQVIEPAFGLSRTVLAVMFDCYDEEVYTDGNGNEQTRVVTRFPEHLAPVRYAILPLIKKDEAQVKLAKELYARLSENHIVEYDDGGAIGKRYRRQDEIGTPRCITIDQQSLEDGTVTMRKRDTMEQERVKAEDII